MQTHVVYNIWCTQHLIFIYSYRLTWIKTFIILYFSYILLLSSVLCRTVAVVRAHFFPCCKLQHCVSLILFALLQPECRIRPSQRSLKTHIRIHENNIDRLFKQMNLNKTTATGKLGSKVKFGWKILGVRSIARLDNFRRVRRRVRAIARLIWQSGPFNGCHYYHWGFMIRTSPHI